MSAEVNARAQVTELVDLYYELCPVNRRIGIWDMR